MTGRTGRWPHRRKEHRTKRFPRHSDDPRPVSRGHQPASAWPLGGDLSIGKGSRSAIGTLVERTTRFTILVHLAGNRGAENFRAQLVESITVGSRSMYVSR